MKRITILSVLAACALSTTCGVIETTLEAQTLPLTVKIGVDPDTSATAPMGYTVQLDAGAFVDVGLPASTSCKAFVGGASSTCVPFSVSVPTLGTHTVQIAGYNLGGTGTATTITFTVTAASGNPANVRIVK